MLRRTSLEGSCDHVETRRPPVAGLVGGLDVVEECGEAEDVGVGVVQLGGRGEGGGRRKQQQQEE